MGIINMIKIKVGIWGKLRGRVEYKGIDSYSPAYRR